MLKKWSEIAEIRYSQIESGLDITFNKVFLPMYIDLVKEIKPNTILEVGAGTGHIAKELVRYVDSITAIEPAEGMFGIAQNVLLNSSVKLLNLDVFEMGQNSSFDLVISHLVAHVVENLNLFLSTIKRLLKPGGKVIFSIPHPCFYNDYKQIFDDNYVYMMPMYKNISFTITKDIRNVINDVPYYHRPISTYINEIIKTGFTIDYFDEVYPNSKIQALYGDPWSTPRYCLFICKN